MIIGSAAGQEVKAALTYGAGEIDAVEMVGTVVDLGLKKYAEYNGRIFLYRNVKTHIEEGRRFLQEIIRNMIYFKFLVIIQLPASHLEMAP